MGRYLCSGIILLSSFYAWLMTATGIQLTQYRPAYTGWIGQLQPYVLAALVHIAITYFYLRLASAREMQRRELMSMFAAAPFVLVFAGWTIFMSSYSIMFERRSETARVESSNQLQAIADELRSLDRQVTTTYLSTMTNLDQRLESEISRPEPGVLQGCGRRCKEIRAVQSEMQNFQHLRSPALTPTQVGADLGKELGVLEGEQQQVAARLADFQAALAQFSRLNAVLAERLVTVDETSSRLTGQYRNQIDRLHDKLTAMRSDERNLTDAKFRGLTELVNDVSSAIASGQIARLLDLFTVFLIAAAPDFLSLIIALLARTLRPPMAESLPVPSPGTIPVSLAIPEAKPSGNWLKQLKRVTTDSAAANSADAESINALVKEHFRTTPKPHSADEDNDREPQLPSAPRVPTESETIYEQLEKMNIPTGLKRRPSRLNEDQK